MLQKNEMVRKAIEFLYTDKCDVFEYQKIKVGSITKHQEVPVIQNQKCRLSFSTVRNANSTDSTNDVTQIIKLFVPPDLNIKAGSKIVVTKNGITTEYKNSGLPAHHTHHNEIVLEIFKGWS